MIESVTLRSCGCPILLEAKDIHGITASRLSPSMTRFNSRICCSTTRSNHYIPKLEPFSRTKFERVIKEPPLIEKSETELAGNLSTLMAKSDFLYLEKKRELLALERKRIVLA